MFAVIKTGGKQYRASAGDTLKVEKLEADEGASVQFDEVLMVGEGDSVTIGKPFVDGGSVAAKVLKQDRSKKVEIVKFHRRQNYRRTKGHRQPYTLIEITDVSGGAA